MKLNFKCLSGNALKIIAAFFMVVDHIGVFFFPYSIIFRILGRISYPIFAFMIAEGARYTRNKVKYLSTIAGLGLICQVVYYLFDRSLYMCILITFSLSIIMIYALSYFKRCLFSRECEVWRKALAGVMLALAVCGTYLLNTVFMIDYGFAGCMVPVFASLFDFRGIDVPERYKWIDSLYMRIGGLTVGLIFLNFAFGSIEWFTLLAIPLLLCYSERRGTPKLKYFFYIFYPLHLAVLQGIQMLIQLL